MGGEGGDARVRSHLVIGAQSKYEQGLPGGTVWSDPQTAHNGAGDPEYKAYLPETCALCKAQDLAAEETEANSEI